MFYETASGVQDHKQHTLPTPAGRISGLGGTPLYKLYRYVPPQRVWFLSHFGLKTGIDFDHYGLKYWAWFSREPVGSVLTYLSIQLQMDCREREVSKIYHSS